MAADRFHLTARTGLLAEAATRIARLLPGRSLQPNLAGVLIRAAGDAVELIGTDGELTAQVRVPATVHTAGEAMVSRRGLAETLGALDTHEVRLSIEGSRLAVRAPSARFALPQLDIATYPQPPAPPPVVGTIPGSTLKTAAIPVAGAASREHALPMFTGIRLRTGNDRLSLLATDRFRMAFAAVDWPSTGGEIDALVPSAFLAQVAKQVGGTDVVAVHADGDRFGLAWSNGVVVAQSLGAAFPDRQLDQLLDLAVECVVEVEADALAGAVHRAVPYAGPHGRLTIQVGDGAVVVRSSDALAGDSEETVKSSVQGDHLTRHYQARFLLDALQSFARQTVSMTIQPGLRATAFSAVDTSDVELRYLVVPMRHQEQ